MCCECEIITPPIAINAHCSPSRSPMASWFVGCTMTLIHFHSLSCITLCPFHPLFGWWLVMFKTSIAICIQLMPVPLLFMPHELRWRHQFKSTLLWAILKGYNSSLLEKVSTPTIIVLKCYYEICLLSYCCVCLPEICFYPETQTLKGNTKISKFSNNDKRKTDQTEP